MNHLIDILQSCYIGALPLQRSGKSFTNIWGNEYIHYPKIYYKIKSCSLYQNKAINHTITTIHITRDTKQSSIIFKLFVDFHYHQPPLLG